MELFERAYIDELSRRPKLDANAFYEQFYADSEIPKEIPVRLRRLYQKIIGIEFDGLQPEDNLAVIFEGLDFDDVLWRVGREFQLTIPPTALKEPFVAYGQPCHGGMIDGTFDSLVGYVAMATHE